MGQTEHIAEHSLSPEGQEMQPVFRTRAFEILALSTAPEGLDIVTNRTLPRPSGLKHAIEGEMIGGVPLVDKISGDIHDGEVPFVLKKALKAAQEEDPAIAEEYKSMQEAGIPDDQIVAFKRIHAEKN